MIPRPSSLAPSERAKHLLVCLSESAQLEELLLQLAEVPGCHVDRSGSWPRILHRDEELVLHPAQERGEILELLHSGYYNFVVLDLRGLAGGDQHLEHAFRCAASLVDALAGGADVETGYGFHRIIALVSAGDDDRADSLIADLGRRGVGRVLRDRTPRPRSAPQDPRSTAFAKLFLDEVHRRAAARKVGRRALCCSGGGITGIYFEMGVLKCFDDCLSGDGVGAFDDYYGISAGAIVNGFLANGFTIDELFAAVAGHDGGRLGKIDFSLFQLRHLNLAAYGRRLVDQARDFAGQVAGSLRGQSRLSLEGLVLRYGDLLLPPLRGDAFEEVLREIFSRPGVSDDFRQLRRRLFVGATDQDRRSHVVFGSPGHDDVPVSKAIHASFALNPAFASTRIGNAYYEDGAVTRTSNFTEAITNGADLVIIVDPFVPYVSRERGEAHRRGFFYNIDQDVRTLSYTRFERARVDSLRKQPWVSTYTFLPANRLRQLMSQNPMDHRPYLPIWRGAYLSTLRRLHAVAHRLGGDLRTHGLTLDTRRADAVADRLEHTRAPGLADFFPDGRILLHAPEAAPSSLGDGRGGARQLSA